MTTFWSIAGTKTPKKYPGRGFLLQPTPNANENLFVNLALIRYCLDTTGGVWRGPSVCDSTSPGKNFVGRLGKKVVQKGPFGGPKGTFWTFQSTLLDSWEGMSLVTNPCIMGWLPGYGAIRQIAMSMRKIFEHLGFEKIFTHG